jgi:hypothetical protein
MRIALEVRRPQPPMKLLTATDPFSVSIQTIASWIEPSSLWVEIAA